MKPKKICLIVDCLSSGGAERLAANMSISLSNNGFDIYIVSMQNKIDYDFKGKLYNFGKIKEQCNRFNAFFKFNEFFKKNNFDFLIDHRLRTNYLKEIIFSKFVFKKNRIFYCVHNYNLSYYFSFLNFPWLATLPHVKQRVFVSVCKEIQNHLEGRLSVKSMVIYNYLPKHIFTYNDLKEENTFDYIIGVGRLTDVKQFDKLIKGYSHSRLPENGIKLIILGDGAEKTDLEKLIFDLNLGDLVNLYSFRSNPYGLIKNAKALVLSSKVEGFPMVLLESLKLNTPVIAFNCKSGPDEIISNNKNGLLVQNQNVEQLALGLNKLILDESFYRQIKENTQYNLDNFSEEKIIQKWINLFENEI